MSLAQLLTAGLDHDAIRRRVRDGRLHRMHRGVYAVGHPGLSFDGCCMAAVLACGDGSAISHIASAELLRASRWPVVLTVSTPAQRRPAGVVTHRTRLDPRDVTKVRGIPVTTVARTLIDLSDTMTPYQLAYVIHQAAYWNHFHLEATRRAMARSNGRRGLKRLERAIELHLGGSAGTRSAKEDAFLASLPEAERESALVNTKIEVDVQWPASGQVVEVDGTGHGRPSAQGEDERRDKALRAAGWTVQRLQSRAR